MLFRSGAVLEAAAMGAYAYALQAPQGHIINLPGGYLQYGGGVPMHTWPGVCRYGMPRGDVSEPKARQQYVDFFLGPMDGKAGQRVIEVAEGL